MRQAGKDINSINSFWKCLSLWIGLVWFGWLLEECNRHVLKEGARRG